MGMSHLSEEMLGKTKLHSIALISEEICQIILSSGDFIDVDLFFSDEKPISRIEKFWAQAVIPKL